MLLDGVHLIGDAMAAGVRLRHAAVAADAADRSELRPLVERLESSGIELVAATAPVMAVLSPVRSSSPIVAIAERPAPDDRRLYAERSLVIVAVDVQDPGNMGAIVRVAEAGGASGVVAAGACADPFGWKALRGSMGSAVRLPVAIRHDPRDAIADARRHRRRVVATAPRGGRSLFEVDLTNAAAVLIGGEGAGLPDHLVAEADERVTIPMEAPVESLNTAVAAAVIVYEARRQRMDIRR